MGANDFLTKKRAAEIVGKSTTSYNNDYAIKSYLLSEFTNGKLDSAVNGYKDTQFVEEKYWSKKASSPSYDTLFGQLYKGETINGIPTDFYLNPLNSNYNTDMWVTFGKPQYEYGGICFVFQMGDSMPGYKYTSNNINNIYDESGYYEFSQPITSVFINGQSTPTNPYTSSIELGDDLISIFIFAPKGNSDSIKAWGFGLGLKEGYSDNVLHTPSEKSSGMSDMRIQVYKTTDINDLPYGLCYDGSQWWYVNWNNKIYWAGSNTLEQYRTYLNFDN